MAWQWRDNGVTMAWQWSDNGVTMEWQWRDNGVTMEWQWSDNGVTMEWQWNENGVTMEWSSNTFVHKLKLSTILNESKNKTQARHAVKRQTISNLRNPVCKAKTKRNHGTHSDDGGTFVHNLEAQSENKTQTRNTFKRQTICRCRSLSLLRNPVLAIINIYIYIYTY